MIGGFEAPLAEDQALTKTQLVHLKPETLVVDFMFVDREEGMEIRTDWNMSCIKQEYLHDGEVQHWEVFRPTFGQMGAHSHPLSSPCKSLSSPSQDPDWFTRFKIKVSICSDSTFSLVCVREE